MKWSELSMTERNEVIKMAVAQGIRDISSIKNLYEESINGSRRFEDGGGMEITPRTTGGAGYIPNNYGQGAIDYIRRKLYDNILPWGYNDIPQRVYNAVVRNKKEEDETRDRAIRDDLFATYLQIPNSERHNINGGKATLSKSEYKPKGAVKDKPTYRFAELTPPAKYGILAYAGQVPGGLNIEGGDYLPIGKNRVIYPNDINAFSELEGLGQFTVGRGYDKKGEYISYYDSWDLGDTNNPYKDMSLGIGKPFNVYDRIYLDDYYKVPEPTHSTYLPEIIVWGDKKAEGGPIHIAPSKRGTFTAAASKHGKSVQEFASQVLAHKENYSPAMVKKANFARNASKWKHSLGGYLFEGGPKSTYEEYIEPSSVEGATAKLALQLADPTGISSYPDVYEAGAQLIENPSWSNLGNLAWETIGALPMLGKISAPYKAAKTAKLLAKIGEASKAGKAAEKVESINKAIDTVPELIPGVRKLAEKTQDLTTKYVIDPIFLKHASKNKTERVKDFRRANHAILLLNGSNSASDLWSGGTSIWNNVNK